MKKNSAFWHIAALFALSLTFLFSSCADFTSSSSGTGSVSFSLSPSVFRSALENLNLEEFSNYSFRLDVFVKGDYEAKQTKTWSDLVAAIESNADSITEEMEYSEILTLIAQKLSDGSTFSFGNIPTGKKVRVEGKFYQIVTYEREDSEREASEASIEELLFHGSSAEKTIESGTNPLSLSIFKAYAEFPLEITLNFPAGTETAVSSSVYSLSLVMAVSDSDKVKELSELLASGDKLTLYNKIKEFQQSDSFWDYPRISCVLGNYEISGTYVTITDTVSLPVSITDKNSGEELAIIPIIYDPVFAGKYCVSDSIPKITPVKGQTTSTSFDVQKLGIIDTATVTYTYDSETGMNYYLDSGSEFQVPSYSPNFCFDADGYFYALDNYESDNISIQSSNTKITDGSLSGVGNLSGITVDHATNILYAWYGMQATFSIYKLPTVISQGNSDGMVTISPTFDSTVFESDNNGDMCYHDGELLVINNGKAYGFVSGGNPTLTDGKFYELDLTEETPAAELIDINDKISEALPGVSESATITDMIYQDGAVYMLLNDSRTENDESKVYSRGAVIKYDTLSGNIKTVGWTEGKETKDVKTGATVGQSGYQLYERYDVESDFDTGVPYVYDFGSNGGGRDYSFYAPYDNIDSVFAGPQKFVAIKPKKLVIADSGVAFYTDSDGVLKYKNVNRVVYVDLESLSITGAEDVSNVNFCSSYPVPGITNIYSNDTEIATASLYRWTTSDGGKFTDQHSSSYVQLYAGFIKGE
ncbi:MAG: hypothetical protein IJ207_10895 [Treponema sp.]|uniref:hypothetical protein n=1 Tax=Treponema sp. TaxID=166 RepID=UPI0025FECB55|nr:hypothetical protein [Treponema sp.]MBQ9282680.1 hypothetical protein [Treponema sp.]